MKALFLYFALLLSTTVHAGQWPQFNDKSFDEDQRAGHPIVLAFYAWWNSPSRIEKDALEQILLDKKYAKARVYMIEFKDPKNTALKKRFGVTAVSTLVVFKGMSEVGRGTGLTDGDAIEDLLKKAYE